MVLKLFRLFLIGFVLLGISNAHAEEKIKVVAFAGIPWSSLSSAQRSDGIVPRFWQEVEQRSGLSIDLEIQPYKRMIYSLENAQADMAIFFRSAKSEKIADPVLKIISLPTVVISNQKGVHHTYQDLEKMKIALKKGVMYEPNFDRNNKIAKVSSDDYDTAVKLMAAGRVDAAVGSQVSLAFHMAVQKLEKNLFSYPFILKNNDVYLQISKKTTLPMDMRRRVIEAVTKLAQDDYYQILIDQAVYYGKTGH